MLRIRQWNRRSMPAVVGLSLVLFLLAWSSTSTVYGQAAARNPQGQQGQGNQQADFQPLIDLITNTVSPKTWQDPAGGPGTLKDFPTGVWVDPQGTLRPLLKEAKTEDLAALRTASAQPGEQNVARKASPLRMISLTRLEKQMQAVREAGEPVTEEMRFLAGLRRIKYVFVYPETHDLVIAGPAGDWAMGPENRVLSTDTGEPIVNLDDLVVVFRHMMHDAHAMFGCKITPRQDALKKAQDFLAQWSKRPVPVEGRRAWLEAFRAALGKQDIEFYGGLDPHTRAAHIMAEADYRMKLVGMGLESGVPGVTSYLNLIKGNPPPMGVLRWWFNLNYDAITTSKDRQAFAFSGQGVKVESENEHLTAQGERVHTGESEPLNLQFAKSFTDHFDALCLKYPVYAELRNLCDLALTAALIRQEGLADKVEWQMGYFGNPQAFAVARGEAPKAVDTVVGFRVVSKSVFVAGVSGGVRVQPSSLVSRQAISVEDYPKLQDQRPFKAPKTKQLGDRWWWD